MCLLGAFQGDGVDVPEFLHDGLVGVAAREAKLGVPVAQVVDAQELIDVTTENAKRLYGLKP